MKSYTTLLNLYQSLTNNIQTDNQTFGAQMLNDSIRTIYNLRTGKWWFLEAERTVLTVANQEGYQVPNIFRKVMDLRVAVGNVVYIPEAVFDPDHWKLVIAARMGYSDVPLFWYRQGQQVLIRPIPATTGNSIVFRGRVQPPDLAIADYVTGTVTTATVGLQAIVGTGTVWTKDMIGRSIRITQTTATNGGDGEWYEIGGWTDATHISLLKPYEGTSIVAGTAAYNIGQMSLIPQAYDVAPVYRAVALYWANNGDIARTNQYWRMYDGGVEAGLSQEYGGLIGQMIENESDKTKEGAYIPPFGSEAWLVNTGAFWSPWQSDASGF